MEINKHGYGIVEFNNVINIDKIFINKYINFLQKINPSPFEIVHENEKSYAVNKTGFKFNLEDIASAPNRYNILFNNEYSEYEHFIKQLDQSLYKCLVAYCRIFPDAAKTIWWKNQGHIAHYMAGQSIGPHSDSHIEFDPLTQEASHNQTPMYNTVSSGIYLNDHSTNPDQWSFSGGEIYFEQADYTFYPKAGSVIMYPSNYIGRHEVKSVTNGNRYVYLQFFSYGKNNDFNHNSIEWLKNLQKDVISGQ